MKLFYISSFIFWVGKDVLNLYHLLSHNNAVGSLQNTQRTSFSANCAPRLLLPSQIHISSSKTHQKYHPSCNFLHDAIGVTNPWHTAFKVSFILGYSQYSTRKMTKQIKWSKCPEVVL